MSFSFPFRDAGIGGIEGGGGDCEFRLRFGELAMAEPIDTNLRIPRVAVGEFVAVGIFKLNDPFVGVPGSELFDFPPPGEMAASPEAASVSRNSTQSRENDYVIVSTCAGRCKMCFHLCLVGFF